ncbi:hypothetical protein JTE90_015451 [Oedothorax gibbosus]|uniref:Prokineticin domain-containing protein n=1 Tax=Oedothorax gibbosus TaxID=931172 RepID=A0AAV6UAQ7_9ARAC|nr:hypothetical protein JTE90_015451 [Oedothorax gibbosus]
MKFNVIVLILCFVCTAVTEVTRKCTNQNECGIGECCVQINCITPTQCRKLRKQGEICFPRSNGDFHNPYRFTCPCANSLSCHLDKIDGDYRCHLQA